MEHDFKTAYRAKADGENYIVMADNIIEALDKLEEMQFKNYCLIENKSILVIQ